MTCFIHTADWQLGKPFANIPDQDKRALVRQARLEVLAGIGRLAVAHNAGFILVAGDLFDTNSPDKATVAAACSAIGGMGLPVLVIPGNHDHAGPGSIWEQEFFRREQAALAPNLHLLTDNQAMELDDAVIFPCPLLRRSTATDPTAWLRDPHVLRAAGGKPRIVMAHGSTQAFRSLDDDAETTGLASNLIDLERLPQDEIDYIALGDWHGCKQAAAKAWYAGTPETDRFPKGADNQPGRTLVVRCRRQGSPEVTVVATGRLNWHEIHHEFSGDADLGQLDRQLRELLGSRSHADLLKLSLGGTLSLAAAAALETLLESLAARLLRLKLSNATRIAPSAAELDELAGNAADPLITGVARQLLALGDAADPEQAAVAAQALRMLHAASCREQAA